MRLFSLAIWLGTYIIFCCFARINLYIFFSLIISVIIHFWFRSRLSLLLLALCFGSTWIMCVSQIQLEKRLPKTLEGKTLLVVGTIVSLPQQNIKKASFLFRINTVQSELKLPIKVKLNWYQTTFQLKPGDTWQFQVRLKRPHSFRNPGSLDYEKWLFRRNISATGYVVSGEHNRLIDSHWYHQSMNRLRQFIRRKIFQSLTEEPLHALIAAIVVGDRQDITQTQWQVFRQTGTSHLVAISGIHIGLIGGLVFFMVCFLWKNNSFLTLRLPAKQAAAGISFIAVFLYSALAGFSLPTQRALIMSTVILGAIMLKRHVTAWYAFSLALLTVLVMDPLSVLDTGFWLSFYCVGIIIYGMHGRWQQSSFWWKWGQVHWVVTIGLCPILLWAFHTVSLITPLANLIAVPWFGLIILPLSLLGVGLTLLNAVLGHYVLMLAIKSLQILWFTLQKLAGLPLISLQYSIPNTQILISTIIGVVVLLAPKGFPWRYSSIIFLLPLFTFQIKQPQNGEVWLTLLDVGQGSASVVQTQHHTLIFDTGPGSKDGFNTGNAIILPYLQLNRLKQIDKLIISHGDNDHIGGASSIIHSRSVKEVLSSVPKQFGDQARYCYRGQHWQWDGVRFEMLSPERGNYRQGNNSSCVLKITTGRQSILLTGDIEKPIEQKLLQNQVDLKSTLLIAPHHGSKTSSSLPFIQAVHPKFVLFPVGYRNRFRFPHRSVVRRYAKIGAKQYDTAICGAIHFKLNQNGTSQPSLYREQHRYIWND
jgi:competence protein ComEC